MAEVPEQIVVAPVTLSCVGKELTVTSTVKLEPTQPLTVGVIVYLSTPPAVLVKVCAMVEHDELQFDSPLIVPEKSAAVHVKVVPVTVEFKVIDVVDPLQMVCGVAEPTG